MWGAIASVAAPYVIGALGGLLGGRERDAERDAANVYAGRMRGFDRRVGEIGRSSEAAENLFLQRAMAFNPMTSATQASEAQWRLAFPQIQRALGDLRGGQVASGRLRTGYGMGDQDTFLSDQTATLTDQMATRAMQAAAMQQAANAELGSYAQNTRNTYLDAAYGRAASDYDRALNRAGENRGMWGNILSAAIPASASMWDIYQRSRGAPAAGGKAAGGKL